VTGDFCPACAESILDAAESNRVMREMRAVSKQVNAAIVDPGFITSVRKKLDLDQREAAEIFGGGINAFSRYENGKTKPPLALVKLLMPSALIALPSPSAGHELARAARQ
jgi:HTH-type transcriptional regulator/antitoxin MqsA